MHPLDPIDTTTRRVTRKLREVLDARALSISLERTSPRTTSSSSTTTSSRTVPIASASTSSKTQGPTSASTIGSVTNVPRRAAAPYHHPQALCTTPQPQALDTTRRYQLQTRIVPSVTGYFYSAGYADPYLKSCLIRENAFHKYGNRLIPMVNTTTIWSVPIHKYINTAWVLLDKRIFLVYGFSTPAYPVNEAVSSLKKTTLWNGDVAVFVVGKRKALLKCPDSTWDVINRVVTVYVSRVVEALDLGKEVPRLIRA